MNDNTFYISESARPPGHGNNCHGHKTSIAAGGNGHYPGDSCGCDGGVPAPAANIDMWLIGLVIVAVVMTIKFKNN